MLARVVSALWKSRPSGPSGPSSQPLHQPELERVRKQLVPRIDAHLGRESTGARRRRIERIHQRLVRARFPGGVEGRAPEAIALHSAIRGKRLYLEVRLG